MRNETLSLGLKLLLITVVAGLLLGFTNEVTKQPIADQCVLEAVKARQEVLPSATDFKLIFDANSGPSEPVTIDNHVLSVPTDKGLDNAYVGTDANGTIVGFTAQITVKGYKTPIEVTVGIDLDGKITGLNVGGSDFGETAGLGAKAKDEDFRRQFIGKTYELMLKKASDVVSYTNTVDAITAATITSRAITNGVNDMLDTLQLLIDTVNGGAK